jgi:hypothetical protein
VGLLGVIARLWTSKQLGSNPRPETKTEMKTLTIIWFVIFIVMLAFSTSFWISDQQVLVIRMIGPTIMIAMAGLLAQYSEA